MIGTVHGIGLKYCIDYEGESIESGRDNVEGAGQELVPHVGQPTVELGLLLDQALEHALVRVAARLVVKVDLGQKQRAGSVAALLEQRDLRKVLFAHRRGLVRLKLRVAEADDGLELARVLQQLFQILGQFDQRLVLDVQREHPAKGRAHLAQRVRQLATLSAAVPPTPNGKRQRRPACPGPAAAAPSSPAAWPCLVWSRLKMRQQIQTLQRSSGPPLTWSQREQ